MASRPISLAIFPSFSRRSIPARPPGALNAILLSTMSLSHSKAMQRNQRTLPTPITYCAQRPICSLLPSRLMVYVICVVRVYAAILEQVRCQSFFVGGIRIFGCFIAAFVQSQQLVELYDISRERQICQLSDKII